MKPTPAPSHRPQLVRLDCAHRSACLSVAARWPGDVYLGGCATCPAYERGDVETLRADVTALCVLGESVARGWRRLAGAGRAVRDDSAKSAQVEI